MIETMQALDNVEAIAASTGVDGLYVGPSDLSLDMGVSISGWATTNVTSTPAGASSKRPARPA